MEDSLIKAELKVSSNWTRLSGSEFNNAVETKLFEEDVFIKPELNELLNEDKAILLTRPVNFTEACELNIQIEPRFKIATLSFVCSAAKVELFLGHQYEETIYGIVITDKEENEPESAETDLTLVTYRYDIEILKSGITNIDLKILTQNTEVCIYGIVMLIAPNPNGITTLNQQTINMEKVEELLKSSSQGLSPHAERCKLFLETFNKNQSKLTKSCDNPVTIFEHLTHNLGETSSSSSLPKQDGTLNYESIRAAIRSHIDDKIKALEEKLEARLSAFERRQTEKLDKILEIISDKK